MLRSFRLINHRSFRDEQELSLIPAYDHDRQAVPIAALYGANASGKSNLFKGFRFMHEAVTNSFRSWDVDGGVPRRPFRLDPAERDKPSAFVVEVVLDGIPHTYGFEVDDDQILSEWLYSYPEKRKRILFEREGQDVKFGTTVADQRAKLEVLEELTRPNALFLSLAARVHIEPLIPLYHWFDTKVIFRWVGTFHSETFLAGKIQRHLAGGRENATKLTILLSAADVGISAVGVRDELGPGNQRSSKLLFEHHVAGEMFEFGDESSGTRSWLELILVSLDVLDHGGLLLVDEIDASLHPLLTARLVGLFRDEATNPKAAQLVFTTHDVSLLGTMLGEEVLGRDQVWFVEKDDKGASSLYPLTDFKPRTGENTERRYLGGSYGAVPVLNSRDFLDAVRGR